MAFDIRDFIDSKGRDRGNIHIACPNCQDASTKNPALSINLENGAYHCFKCEGEKNGEIKLALGYSLDKIVPTGYSKVSEVTVTPTDVLSYHTKLINESRLGKQWLLDRGFSLEMIEHYKLGIKRIKRINKLWYAISIPIPADPYGTRYFQKLRIQPWLQGDDRPSGLKAWDQKGISAMVWLTYNPPDATETYLCEGEWDAMMLGWLAKCANAKIAIATFTCGCDTVPPQTELDKLPGRVTIFYDRNDKPNSKTGELPGDKGAIKVAGQLQNRGFIALTPCNSYYEDRFGWDVSDAINAGFKFDDFVAAAALATQPKVDKSENPLRSRLVSNAELMARAPDYIDWLVPDMLPANELFVLAASPRAGKSLMAMLLAKCIATGENFLGRVVTQGAVLYVNLEDSEAKIKQRELAQEWSTDVPIYWLDRFKLSETAHLREIAEEIDARLIILDTLSRIRDDGSQETSAEISRYLEPLQDMAMQLRLSVLLIHHTTKITIENAGSTNVFDTIRGSSAIRGVCRGSWVLAASDRTYRLCVEHGFGEKQDLEVLLDGETLTWKAVRPWNPKSSSTQVEQILEYLKKAKKATIPEIASVLNLNPNYVTTALWRLQMEKQVYKIPGKKYYPATYYYAMSVESLNDLSITYQKNDLIGNEKPCSKGDTANNHHNLSSGDTFDGTKYKKNPDDTQNASDTEIFNQLSSIAEKLVDEAIEAKTNTQLTDEFLSINSSKSSNFTVPAEEKNINLEESSDHLIPKNDTFLLNDNRETNENLGNSIATIDGISEHIPRRKPRKVKVGDRCKWVGDPGAMAVVCKGRTLEILELRYQGLEARVKAPNWACDYWVASSDLRQVKQ
ncbi:AAA family ATPase [Gloeocapsopsis crepidinum LEGE 06123]|uniref:AAA family ATPase n=1 Tax=Gloeocapsopsis crepidinum LEGE 06123 TaxID=588587 RepID=A0ABR9UY63_9CHRO|nr:AAA family ATPase [Gloeocapsopsis crepidinum]MBE9193264.1 AAA family ATPase [Gloeocapsopsis crepidinum LEGE 06123]